MIKKLLVSSIIAAVCTAELVSVSNYVGKHSFKCGFQNSITGALVNTKLYTFGGCYPIPYIVDPNDDDYDIGYRRFREHVNISNTIEVYDIPNNQWTIEENIKTPYPWRKASTQVHDQDVYFYNIRTVTHETSNGFTMWRYNTIDKIWSRLEDLPFIYLSNLISCQANGKIYFSGTGDGRVRNIIQVYNIKTDKWEQPIFPNKRFIDTQQMLCGEKHIHFLGEEKKPEEVEEEEDGLKMRVYLHGIIEETHDLISTEYETGNTYSHGLNITANYDGVLVKDDSFYILDRQRFNSTIFKINTVTEKKTILGTFPHTLRSPLLVPYVNDQVFLFGGGDRRRSRCNSGFSNDEHHCNTLKTYNHKLVPEQNDDNVKLVLQE